MMFCKQRLNKSLGSFLLILMFFGGAKTILALAASDPKTNDFARYLPGNTIFYISLPNLQRAQERSKNLAVAKVLREEEVKEFLAQPAKYAEEKGFPALWKMTSEASGIDFSFLQNFDINSFDLAITGIRVPDEEVRGGGYPGISFLLALGCGDEDAKKLSSILTQSFQALAERDRGKIHIETNSKQGIEVTNLQPVLDEGAPRPNFAWFVNASKFFLRIDVGFGSDERFGIQAQPAGASLLEDNDFKKISTKLAAADTDFLFFLRVGEPLEQALNMARMFGAMNPYVQMLVRGIESSGITNLRALGCTARAETDYSITKYFGLLSTPREGIFAGESKQVDLSLLKLIPDDVASFGISSINIPHIWDVLWQILEDVNADYYEQAKQSVEELEQKLGFKLKEDFIDAFGEKIVGYEMPMQSFLMSVPEVNLFIEIKDKQKAERAMVGLIQLLEQSFPDVVSLKDRDSEEGKLYSVRLNFPDMDHVQMAALANIRPSFSFTENYFVVGLSTSSVKKALQRLTQPTTGTITNKEFERFANKIPKNANSVGYSDPRPTLTLFYQPLQMVGPMISGQAHNWGLSSDLPIDFSLLPSAKTFTKHFFPEVSYWVYQQDGFYGEIFSSVGTDCVIWVFKGLKYTAGIVAGVVSEIKEAEAKKQVESNSSATGEFGAVKAGKDKAELTKRDLTDLQAGLQLYRLEKGKYPPLLGQLLIATEDYPTGYLPTHIKIPKDPWGNDYFYKVDAEGKGYSLRSFGPNGLDEEGQGDDISAN